MNPRSHHSGNAPAADPADPCAEAQEILDCAQIAAFVKDLEGRYLFVNPEFGRLRGQPPDDIVGLRDADIAPDRARHWRAQDRAVVEVLRAINFEDTIETEQGPRTFISHRFPILDAHGEPCAVGCVAIDITERRRDEEALRAAALAVSSAEGDAVFADLCQSLANILGVDGAFVAVFDDAQRTRMRSLACRVDGKFLQPFEYPLEGSPCAAVVGREFRFVASGVLPEFPPGTLFHAKRMDSYAAMPLNDATGAPLGLIAVVDRKAMRNRSLAESILKIFAARASAEIDRRRALEALRLSEAQYRAIFNASEDALMLWNSRLQRVDVNPAHQAIFGFAREDVVGRAFEGLPYPEEFVRPRLEMIRRALAGEASHAELEALTKEGRRIVTELRVIPFVHHGEPHVLQIARDVTAPRRAAEALRASEEQYRAIFNASEDALVLWDSQFRRVDVNAAYERLYGWTRDEVIGRGYEHPMFTPEYARPRLALVRRALDGEACQVELEAIRKDGSRVPTEVRAMPFEHRGRPHVLTIARDITERKRAEQALRASEEQYRAIFNASEDALVLWDSRYRRVDVNPAYERIYGYARDEVVGDPRIRELPAAMEDRWRDIVRRTLAGERCHVELDSARRDGTPLRIEVRTIPIRHLGEPHVLAIVRDITDRVAAEARRAELEAQLQQAQKMEALGQLTGGIAHDFNNLLTGIMGYVALASEQPAIAGDARLSRYMDQAYRSCERARDLIQQMLAFGRGRAAAPRRVALQSLVADALGLLRASFSSSVGFRTRLAADAPEVLLDPIQLEQVLMNLMINARDAMPRGGEIDVAVAARRIEGGRCESCREAIDGVFVELAVADGGTGIPAAVQERMFEPFFTTKEVGRGSGMGLATVHGIVHAHGGHVVVESPPGGGATFRVLLPPAQGPRGEQAAAPAVRGTPPLGPLDGRVLLVDDEPAVVDYMVDLLASWGLAVQAATSPAVALARLAADPLAFDVVLTDQTMPGMSGLDLARAAAAARPSLPVLVYSGNREAVADAARGVAQVRAVLHKPIDLARLHEALGAALAGRGR